MYKPVESEAQALRRYDPLRVLLAISVFSLLRERDPNRLARMLAKENINALAAFRDCQLAFVAKLVLHFFDKPRLSRRRFTWDDLLKACQSLTKHQTPNSYPVRSRDDVDRFFIRLAYQQFPDFYGDRETFARTHLLFRTCAKEVETDGGFNIDNAYDNATGLTLDKAWEITLALCGELLTNRKYGTIIGPMRAGNLEQILDIRDSDIARFIDMISKKPQEFQEIMKEPLYRIDPFETFNPNPLVMWPMLEVRENRWIIPIYPYLFRRGTEQMFYDVIAHKGREFTSFLGHVFEKYADQMLLTIGSSYEVIPAQTYRRGNDEYVTCDRIIIKDGNAVLIECKTKRLGLKTKLTADEQLLRDDLTDIKKRGDKSNVVHAIRQLHRTEQAIRAGHLGLEGLNKKINGKMYPIVLTLDAHYLANGEYVKRIIREELGEGDYPIKNYNWQIIDARGFELLCALAQKEDFLSIIKDKFSSSDKEVQDMTTFAEYKTENGQQITRQIPDHPAIRRELEKFWGNLEISRVGSGIDLT